MAKLTVAGYACNICGTEITVTGDGTGYLEPIYCCSVKVREIELGKPKKAAAKKGVKQTAKKKTTAKKRVKIAKKTSSAKSSKKKRK